MSKQLAISSSFAIFAMAAMALLHKPAGKDLHRGGGLWSAQVEAPAPDLPRPFSLFD